MSLKTKTYEVASWFDPADSVFVSANAGAGKTRRLTDRVLALLLSGVMPSRILCLTFTKAAAAEMAARVQSQLGAWVMMEESALAEALQGLLQRQPAPREIARARGLFAEVLEAPEGVRILTIHSLCQSLLRRFPMEAGVSPHFEVMDARSEQAMQQDAYRAVLAQASASGGDLAAAVRHLAKLMAESRLEELLGSLFANKRRLLPHLASQQGVDDALGFLRQQLRLEARVTRESLFASHFEYTPEQVQQLRHAAAVLLEQEKCAKANLETGKALADWLENAPQAGAALAAYVDVFVTAKFEPRKVVYGSKTVIDESLAAAIAAEQQRVLAYVQRSLSLEVYEGTASLLRFVSALLMHYQQCKDSRALLDYDDLINQAHALLTRAQVMHWVLYKLDGGIDHMLVDEAQDTSARQWAIVEALTAEFFSGEGRSSEPRSLFIVGDEKQSIFSFQGADPGQLAKWQHVFSQRIADAGHRSSFLSLIQSYRSTQEILNVVDAVFAQPHVREGLTFHDQDIIHKSARTGAAGLVELWPLIEPPAEDMDSEADDSETVSYRPAYQLAAQLARRLKQWFAEGRQIAALDRAMRPGDVMILVQKRGKLVDALVRALKKQGIPVAGHDRMQLNDNLAVQDMLALAQVMVLPEDDLTLAALLKCPLFDITEDDLFALAHDRGRQPLWERMKAQSADNARVANAYRMLAELRAMADLVRPYEFYIHVLDTLGGRERILSRMGHEYRDPIDEFLGQALVFERSHPPSLQGFLLWLSRSRSEIKRDMEQVGDAVRILTVHASKGLQAPVVILPDTAAEPSKDKDSCVWFDAGDISLPVWKQGLGAEAFCRRLSAEIGRDRLAENRRLLYVALTRASDQLYICGALGLKKLHEDSWYALIRSAFTPLLAEPCVLEGGEGWRVGMAPKCGRAAAVPSEPLRSAAADAVFLRRQPPAEPSPPKPLVPSKLVQAKEASASPLDARRVYQRGRLIHQLLQHLPSASQTARGYIAQRLASRYADSLGQTECEAALAEAIRVMEDPAHAFLFGEGSLAEVPIAGLVSLGDAPVAVSGQIDRMAITPSEVFIVDFKSNQRPPAQGEGVPAAYVRQLRLYQLVVGEIYKDKTISCGLLWTAVPLLVKLPQSLLDEASLSTYI